MKNLRIREAEKKEKYHPDFEVVRRGLEDVMVVTWGGKSGTVYTDPNDYQKYEDYHIFLKTHGDHVIQNLKSIEPKLLELANRYARARNCYLEDVVRVYSEEFGRPEVI